MCSPPKVAAKEERFALQARSQIAACIRVGAGAPASILRGPPCPAGAPLDKWQ